MKVYNMIFNATSEATDERLWVETNEHLYKFFLDKQKNFIGYWQKELSDLVGLPFLERLSAAWEKMKIYLRWSITIFLPIDKYSRAYKGISLL